MLRNIVYTFCIMLSLTGKALAQNTTDYSFYNKAMNVINPAFAGQEKEQSFLLNIRNSDVNSPESPTSGVLLYNTHFSENLGTSFGVSKDKLHITDFTNITTDVSYSVPLDHRHKLLFGMGAKGTFANINYKELTLENTNDPSFANNYDNFHLNLSAGIGIETEKYFAHISMLDILKQDNDNELSSVIQQSGFHVGGGYHFSINNEDVLSVSTLMRQTKGAPVSWDINATLSMNQKVELGVSYRLGTMVFSSVYLPVTRWLQVGYTLGYNTHKYSKPFGGNTHEFLLKFPLTKS